MALLAAGIEVDAALWAGTPTTLARHVAERVQPTRMLAVFLSAFAVLAVLLATIGLYGTVRYAVASRTREVGIRMALGGDRATVTWLLMLGGLRLVGVGVGVGFAASFLATPRARESSVRGRRARLRRWCRRNPVARCDRVCGRLRPRLAREPGRPRGGVARGVGHAEPRPGAERGVTVTVLSGIVPELWSFGWEYSRPANWRRQDGNLDVAIML